MFFIRKVIFLDMIKIISISICLGSLLFSCNTKKANNQVEIKKYTPKDTALYKEILAMDKIFFDAYNTCDLEKQASIYSDKVEFFHDKSGVLTSKKEILEGTKNFICGKVTRELVKESVEVHPINNYGAVQIGFHKFYNNQEPDAESVPSKFITLWNKTSGDWKMEKVISLH